MYRLDAVAILNWARIKVIVMNMHARVIGIQDVNIL